MGDTIDDEVIPTAPERSDQRAQGRDLLARRVILTVLVVFLVAATIGAFGVRTREASADGGGYELTVRYGAVTRPGLATPWSLEIRRTDGAPFSGPVTVATTSDYLDLFDENGLDPEPSESTADGERVMWEFDPPDGDVLTVTFDARIEPGMQWGKRGETSIVEDGRDVVTVGYRTWVLP